MDKLQQLMNDIGDWSDATFGEGQRNPAILYHLKKEVQELIDEFEKTEIDEFKKLGEYADCFMLLLDSARKYGISAGHLIRITREKLEINKKREWGKPDENGVVEHIKLMEGNDGTN